MAEDILKKENTEENNCHQESPNATCEIPIDRVIKKLDEYLNANDYNWAEQHLIYWANEARVANANDSLLFILNEQVGLYRQTKKEEEGLSAAKEALQIAKDTELENTVIMGTTLINVATAYKSFGKTKEALELYEKAREIYEHHLEKDDEKLASLYNNMAVSLLEVENYDEAEELFKKALEVLKKLDHGAIEMAITYCNLADFYSARYGTDEGENKINECLNKAEELLDKEELNKGGYYAYVCENCSSVFLHYGFFFVADKLKKRAEKIYELNLN